MSKGQKDYARRDSNPGRVDGNDTSYPWTTPVLPLFQWHLCLLKTYPLPSSKGSQIIDEGFCALIKNVLPV